MTGNGRRHLWRTTHRASLLTLARLWLWKWWPFAMKRTLFRELAKREMHLQHRLEAELTELKRQRNQRDEEIGVQLASIRKQRGNAEAELARVTAQHDAIVDAVIKCHETAVDVTHPPAEPPPPELFICEHAEECEEDCKAKTPHDRWLSCGSSRGSSRCKADRVVKCVLVEEELITCPRAARCPGDCKHKDPHVSDMLCRILSCRGKAGACSSVPEESGGKS